MDETIAEIRNKLQAPKTVLERLSCGETVSKSIIKIALKDLDKIVKLLSKL